MFQFENFRVRKLTAINALNFYITLCMAFLAHMSMKSETHALKVAIIQKADPIKEKIHFSYYPDFVMHNLILLIPDYGTKIKNPLNKNLLRGFF